MRPSPGTAQMAIGKGASRPILTPVRKLGGQLSTGPTAVAPQSIARQSARTSPAPANTVSGPIKFMMMPAASGEHAVRAHRELGEPMHESKMATRARRRCVVDAHERNRVVDAAHDRQD